MSIINEALKKAEQEKNKMLTDEPGYTNIASKIYKPKPEQNEKLEAPQGETVKPLPLLEPLPPVAKKHNYLTWALMAILITIAVMSLSILLTKPKGKNIEPKIKQPAPTPQPSLPSQANLNSAIPAALSTQPALTDNPPTPEPQPVKLPSAPPPLILSGIVAGGNDSFAIIDGNIVKKGDSISGAKVKEIYGDRVALEFDGAEFILRSP